MMPFDQQSRSQLSRNLSRLTEKESFLVDITNAIRSGNTEKLNKRIKDLRSEIDPIKDELHFRRGDL